MLNKLVFYSAQTPTVLYLTVLGIPQYEAQKHARMLGEYLYAWFFLVVNRLPVWLLSCMLHRICTQNHGLKPNGVLSLVHVVPVVVSNTVVVVVTPIC